MQVCICMSQMGGLDSPVFVVLWSWGPLVGVLTLKGPVNCEDLRHETVPPNWPRGQGFTRRMWAEHRNWTETSSHKPPLHSERQRSRMIARQRETLRCADWMQFTSKSLITTTNVHFFLYYFVLDSSAGRRHLDVNYVLSDQGDNKVQHIFSKLSTRVNKYLPLKTVWWHVP